MYKLCLIQKMIRVIRMIINEHMFNSFINGCSSVYIQFVWYIKFL